MPAYANTTGRSNVKSYRVTRERVAGRPADFERGSGGFGLETEEAIEVTFGDGSVYVYTATSAGAANVRKMIQLAEAGSGLNSFINLHVRKLYARKL